MFFSCDLSVHFSICSRTDASALLFICFTHLSLDLFGVYQRFSLLFLFVWGVFWGVFFSPHVLLMVHFLAREASP